MSALLKKTHAAVGAAAALYMVKPDTIEGVALAVTAGIVGGLLCDIDATKTAIHQKAVLLVTAAAAIIIIGTLTGRVHIDLNQLGELFQDEAMDPRAAYGAILLVLCLIAAFTRHRSFAHSIVFAVAVYWLMKHTFEAAAIPFAAGVVSHIAIDLLNDRGVQLFWPIKGQFSFRLCSSKGTVNSLFFYIGVGAAFLEAAQFLGITHLTI